MTVEHSAVRKEAPERVAETADVVEHRKPCPSLGDRGDYAIAQPTVAEAAVDNATRSRLGISPSGGQGIMTLLGDGTAVPTRSAGPS